MLLTAATLAVASALHLTGQVHGRNPFDPDHAGIAEAIIGVVLAGAGLALIRGRTYARSIAIGALSFAIVGFGIGLTFTTRGGDLPDIAYHLAILPLLIATLAMVVRTDQL
jgi:hypothetical protein